MRLARMRTTPGLGFRVLGSRVVEGAGFRVLGSVAEDLSG